MTQHHQFKAGDAVLFNHCEGKLPAKIVRLSKHKGYAIIEVKGWLGTHWEPLSKLEPDVEKVGGTW